jgi:hypothetical protein
VRLPQSGGLGPRFYSYIPKEQGDPFIPPGTGFPLLSAQVKVKVEVILRSMVSLPFCLGVGHPSVAHDQIFITVGQLRASWCGAPSLTRGWICNLLVLMLLGLVSAVTLGSKSLQNSWPYITVSFETPLTRRDRSSYLYPPGTGWHSYTPRHWVPFLLPLTTRGGIINLLHGQSQSQSQSQSYITTDSRSASPFWCQAPIWDPRSIFLSPWNFL